MLTQLVALGCLILKGETRRLTEFVTFPATINVTILTLLTELAT
jgi:hypothetical protein